MSTTKPPAPLGCAGGFALYLLAADDGGEGPPRVAGYGQLPAGPVLRVANADGCLVQGDLDTVVGVGAATRLPPDAGAVGYGHVVVSSLGAGDLTSAMSSAVAAGLIATSSSRGRAASYTATWSGSWSIRPDSRSSRWTTAEPSSARIRLN